MAHTRHNVPSNANPCPSRKQLLWAFMPVCSIYTQPTMPQRTPRRKQQPNNTILYGLRTKTSDWQSARLRLPSQLSTPCTIQQRIPRPKETTNTKIISPRNLHRIPTKTSRLPDLPRGQNWYDPHNGLPRRQLRRALQICVSYHPPPLPRRPIHTTSRRCHYEIHPGKPR